VKIKKTWDSADDYFHLGGREQEDISHGGTSAMGRITRLRVETSG
jgi:hypothetical protein